MTGFRGEPNRLESFQRTVSSTLTLGAGFDVRNQNHADVDDELDIDGDDAAQFGDAQFNENDIVALHDEDVEVDIDESDGEELNEGGMVRKASLRQMVAQVTSSQRTAQNLPHDDTPEHANGSSTPTIDVKGKQKAASQDFPSLVRFSLSFALFVSLSCLDAEQGWPLDKLQNLSGLLHGPSVLRRMLARLL
jgi:hypothetical protein